ncbi:MAG: DUF4160 domain-containing protein [Bacteroidia bacterium]
MPRIAYYKYFTFFIYMYDLLNEPLHLHVVKEKGNRAYAAKIWLDSLEFAESGSLSQKEVNLVQKLVGKNKEMLIALCLKAKKGEKIKFTELKLK